MVHVETPGIIRVAVSREMFNRIDAVKTFLLHAKRRPTNEMLTAYGIASLGDFLSAKSYGQVFYSCRGSVLIPFSLTKIREDMRAAKITYYDLEEPSFEVRETIREIKRKVRQKDEEIILLGIGFLSDVIERFVAGEVIKVGPPSATIEEMVEYESDALKDYRPVLIN